MAEAVADVPMEDAAAVSVHGQRLSTPDFTTSQPSESALMLT